MKEATTWEPGGKAARYMPMACPMCLTKRPSMTVRECSMPELHDTAVDAGCALTHAVSRKEVLSPYVCM